MDITPERRARFAAIGKVGGLSNSARNDMGLLAATGRRAFRESFQYGHGCKVCPQIDLPADLPDAERDRRADALYRGHFARLAIS